MAHHFTDIQTSFSGNIDPNMGMIINNLYPMFSPSETDTSTWGIQSIMGFSPEESFLTQPPSINGNFQGFFPTDDKTDVSAAQNIVSGANDRVGKKRKPVDTPESRSVNSSGPASENGIDVKYSTGKGKKVKYNGQHEGKRPKDVVHVRARRGQATDSHSLAERVRRGKINERLRCLQDIIPGCHKTMGMAVMLDEIINYVQSLQNQVEFLSMKLTAASTFHNFGTETNPGDIMVLRDKACEAGMIQKLLKERCEIGDGGFVLSSNQSDPFDLSFGCHPSVPYNK